MSRHKPGPWKIGAIESGRYAVDSADDREVTGWIDPEDAWVIIAAPDLLDVAEELQRKVHEFEHWDAKDWPVVMDVLRKMAARASAALVKAGAC